MGASPCERAARRMGPTSHVTLPSRALAMTSPSRASRLFAQCAYWTSCARSSRCCRRWSHPSRGCVPRARLVAALPARSTPFAHRRASSTRIGAADGTAAQRYAYVACCTITVADRASHRWCARGTPCPCPAAGAAQPEDLLDADVAAGVPRVHPDAALRHRLCQVGGPLLHHAHDPGVQQVGTGEEELLCPRL
jgi:hypothetical protein